MEAMSKEDILAEAEDIFGQYLFAVGAGAGQIWVKRRAIHALRDHYFDTIVRAVAEGKEKWDADAPRVLSYLRTIGALAAQYSRTQGLHVIGSGHMVEAVKKVESNYNTTPRPGAAGDPEPMGVWCPPPSGDG